MGCQLQQVEPQQHNDRVIEESTQLCCRALSDRTALIRGIKDRRGLVGLCSCAE